MTQTWDAIVIGARCAGSPAAMLLAKKGYKVLLVDRATFPSDTISTHFIHPPGIASLKRWGLLDKLAATGCPPITRYVFDFGPLVISGSPVTPDAPVTYCPRRTVLDKILVDAARAAGAEVREGFSVEEIVTDGGRVTGVRGTVGGKSVTESAKVVIGADGRYSSLAETVKPEQYNDRAPVEVSYYTYWSNLPWDSFTTFVRPPVGWAVWPTHDNLTLVIVGRQWAENDAYKKDIEGQYMSAFESAPEFAAKIKKAKREDKFYGGPVVGYFRKPFGPGWALVGDAGYNKDYLTAQGISDAFRDAELCTTAIDQALSGKQPFDQAMAGYQKSRDEQVGPMYDFSYQLATLEPPPPDFAQLLGAVSASKESMDEFTKVFGGVISPAQFFNPDHIGKIIGRAQAAGGGG